MKNLESLENSVNGCSSVMWECCHTQVIYSTMLLWMVRMTSRNLPCDNESVWVFQSMSSAESVVYCKAGETVPHWLERLQFVSSDRASLANLAPGTKGVEQVPISS